MFLEGPMKFDIVRCEQRMPARLRISLVSTLTAAFVVCKHTLAVAQGVPDLSRLDAETRQSIELACITQKSDGPVAYGECLRAQLHSIGIQPGETGDATHVPSTGARHARSTGARHVPSTDAMHVPSTEPIQATPREHKGAHSSWQEPFIIVAVFYLGIVAVFYLGPIIWVLSSSRSRGGAKFGWFIVVLLFSWLGLAVFLIVTQALRNRQTT
jgi:hypothetical protein